MIAAGLSHTCAYRPGPANNSSAQAVFCWGYNGDGELGNGTTVNSATPVQVSGITGISFNGAAIRSLGAGAFHSLATMGDGRFLAWGSNNVGQLGDGTTTNRTTATYSYADSSEIAIAGGSAHTCAL